MEKNDTIDVLNPPKSVFGVTLKDAEEYGDKLNERTAHGFINEPDRDIEKETLWDFMASKLSEDDESEIAETMRSLEGEFR
ncbi:MAG: hypothetical protein LBC59_09820 [Chitinispirillales bacterium]|jgi:hypothetical protein|nr:hypothetical protein [Chitinispirillales bacterium]